MYSFNSDIDKRLIEFKENLVAYVQSYDFSSELKDFDFSMVLFDARMALPFNFDKLNVQKNAYVSLEQFRKSSLIDSYKDEQPKPQTKQTKTESNNNWRLPSPEEFISIIDYECQGINGRPNGTIIDELQGYANYWTNKPIIQSGINGRKYAWVFSNINGTQIKKVPIRTDVPIFLICVKEQDGKLIWEQNPHDYPLAPEGIQVYLDQIN